MTMQLAALARACLAGLILISISISQVKAIPTENFHINAQIPPIAQMHQLFNFTFAATTFSAGGSGISYALANSPSVSLCSENKRVKE